MKAYSDTIKLGIKNWAEDDKPREKLVVKGRGALSDAELIAILLGSGTRELTAVDLAKQVLSSFNNGLAQLSKCGIADLKKIKGIGDAKAITIIAALELGRRRQEDEPLKKPRITSSKVAYEVFYSHLADLGHEEFWVAYLNRKNEVEQLQCISKGGVSGTVVDARLIFKPAIESLYSGIILAHNHPSGNTTASEQDKSITKKLIDAGKLLDVTILDHIILGEQTYFSFADEGWM